MPLPAYGLLIGEVTASRPQSGGHPHWLLMVQPSIANHPAYRVAINLDSSDPGAPPEIQYQVVDVDKDGLPGLKALVQQLTKIGQTDSFQTGPSLPALDFVRGGLIDPAAFQTAQAGSDDLKTAFVQALQDAANTDESDKALLAVFGTGYPVQAGTKTSPSTGYTGVDNIHMNQGDPNKVGDNHYFKDNGPNQDGGLIFLLPTGARAFFVKFQSQTIDTDANGNPATTATATPAINDHVAPALAAIKAHPDVQRLLGTPGAAETPAAFHAPAPSTRRRGAPPVPAEPTPAPAPPPPPSYVFADPDPDATETFGAVGKDTYYDTPYVTQIRTGQVRGPVPDPRGSAVSLNLADIVGSSVPGYTDKGGVQTIQFDLIGDSGAVSNAKLVGETAVGQLMIGKAAASQPAFCFHVGDVVYYYGEKQFYYGQFAEVFKLYPAPIFAIPGNHDALTFDASQTSLDSFLDAFCAASPQMWDGFGGIQRSTMTQPGVFFTLDAPLVSIVGLYSNCGESLGWLNDKQYAFLRSELMRLKPLRAAKERAFVLAIHHFPRWFPGYSDPMSASLDALFAEVGLWPDAVVAGHAHIYQRIVRQTSAGAPTNIPYFVNGAGGYGLVSIEKLGGAYAAGLPADMQKVVLEEGFLRASVTKSADAMTLDFTYYGTKTTGGADSYSVTL